MTPAPEPSVVLADTQLASIKIEPVTEHAFPQERLAVGNIDFNQDLLTQVFTQYQGRISKAFAKVGDIVKKDQPLFSIESPDLLQAELTLISAAGVLELTTKNFERQRNLFKQSAAAQKDYEQSVSDQQAAEGAYRAARGAVVVFGKTDAEMDRKKDRKVDATLIVSSPITGLGDCPETSGSRPSRAARQSAAGLYRRRYLDHVDDREYPEREAADLKLGQEVRASVVPYPGALTPERLSRSALMIFEHPARVCPLRDCRSGLRSPRGHVRDLHGHQRCRRRLSPYRSMPLSRRRWQHDGLDH